MQETFLFPQSRQYHFDEACTQLVTMLYDRDFAVAGVEVTFDTYSNWEGVYRMVDTITIPALDLSLHFSRQQGYIDRNRYDCAAVSDLAIHCIGPLRLSKKGDVHAAHPLYHLRDHLPGGAA